MKLVMTLFTLLWSISSLSQETAPALTAVYEDRRQRIKLKWNHQDPRAKTYILQKSADKYSWTDFHFINLAESQQAKFMTFTDQKPGEGKNYYRLKTIYKNGNVQHTAAIMVIIGQPGNSWILYPVPVKNVLNLQYNGNALIPGVIGVFIQSAAGRTFHKLRFASSTRLISIPVSNLGKGIYDIRIVIENQVVWNQRFVK